MCTLKQFFKKLKNFGDHKKHVCTCLRGHREDAAYVFGTFER